MTINALSLWQPWASLIALDQKHFETRSWDTAYRGPLLICASKHVDSQVKRLCATTPFYEALEYQSWEEVFKLCGMALCIVDLVETYRIHCAGWQPAPQLIPRRVLRALNHNERLLPSEPEIHFGDYGAGRYAWELRNLRTFKPFPVSGRQSLFKVEMDPVDALGIKI